MGIPTKGMDVTIENTMTGMYARSDIREDMFGCGQHPQLSDKVRSKLIVSTAVLSIIFS